MGYDGKSPLRKHKGLLEPIHAEFRNPRDKNGVGCYEQKFAPSSANGLVFNKDGDSNDEDEDVLPITYERFLHILVD